MNKYVKKELYELLFLVIYLCFVLGILTLAAGLAGGGFEVVSILDKNNFYLPYGIIFLIGLVAVKGVGLLMFSKKQADKEGVVIHDPEQSPMGGLLIVRNPFLLIFFSIILFSFLGWLFTNQQTFFTQTPNYEQQFTVGADLFFSVYPASPSETLGALFLIGLLGLILGILVVKNKLSKTLFLAIFIPGSMLVSAVYGIMNHLLRYGSSDVAITNVAIFWAFGGLITAITGSVIPFLFLHDINNFFFKLSKLFSNDIVTFITFTAIGILFLTFLLVYIRLKKSKGKSEETIPT